MLFVESIARLQRAEMDIELMSESWWLLVLIDYGLGYIAVSFW